MHCTQRDGSVRSCLLSPSASSILQESTTAFRDVQKRKTTVNDLPFDVLLSILRDMSSQAPRPSPASAREEDDEPSYHEGRDRSCGHPILISLIQMPRISLPEVVGGPIPHHRLLDTLHHLDRS